MSNNANIHSNEDNEWPTQPPHPNLSYIEANPPLKGQTLYLGGEIGPDKNIYCIPGHASRVLAIYPNQNDKCIQIGPEFVGKFKWLRGILACNDIIYGLPCHADSILRIDARDLDQEGGGVKITTLRIPYEECFEDEEECKREKEMIWKYHGGAISPVDNCIYCIPQSASRVLRLDPKDESLSFVGPDLPGKYKWYGGLVGKSDGAIYGVPQNSGSVLRIHPTKRNDEEILCSVNVTLHGDLGSGLHQWHGGGVSSDGTIVCIPNNANTILLIKPPNTTANETDEPQLSIIGGEDVVATGNNVGRRDRKYKYLGSASDEECNVYCFPSGAEYVLRVNTRTNRIDEIGPSLYESKLERLKQNKWQNGFYCPLDKCVYAIPLAAETVLKIDLKSNDDGDDSAVVSTMGLPLDPNGGLAKWEGGVITENGLMYCMPNNFKKVLKIKPSL